MSRGDRSHSETERTYVIDGASFAAAPAEPGLYVVATPIGNLGDITIRALRTLAGVDTILCEDTRVTSRLTERYGIATRLRPYHEHNAERVRPAILAALENGGCLALVSDAGTPLVSDPGYKLVEEVLERDISVTSLPGPSATLAALTVAGLPSDRFLFAGFLPVKAGRRQRALEDVRDAKATLIFYESAKRLSVTLQAMLEVLGDRPAAVARELTKLHETVNRGRLSELVGEFGEQAPRGEIVVLVGPPGASDTVESEDVDSLLMEALNTCSVRESVDLVTGKTGLPRRQVYARAVLLKKESNDEES